MLGVIGGVAYSPDLLRAEIRRVRALTDKPFGVDLLLAPNFLAPQTGAQNAHAPRRDIESETRRAIQEIRREVADLTVQATEKVTRKVLDEADQRRLVDEALRELDFSALAPGDHD